MLYAMKNCHVPFTRKNQRGNSHIPPTSLNRSHGWRISLHPEEEICSKNPACFQTIPNHKDGASEERAWWGQTSVCQCVCQSQHSSAFWILRQDLQRRSLIFKFWPHQMLQNEFFLIRKPTTSKNWFPEWKPLIRVLFDKMCKEHLQSSNLAPPLHVRYAHRWRTSGHGLTMRTKLCLSKCLPRPTLLSLLAASTKFAKNIFNLQVRAPPRITEPIFWLFRRTPKF